MDSVWVFRVLESPILPPDHKTTLHLSSMTFMNSSNCNRFSSIFSFLSIILNKSKSNILSFPTKDSKKLRLSSMLKRNKKRKIMTLWGFMAKIKTKKLTLQTSNTLLLEKMLQLAILSFSPTTIDRSTLQ